MKLMLTCEHASNRLPAAFKKFVPVDVQETHRAYDIGALKVFRKLVKFAKPEFSCEGKFSRLFVDLNRTITNKSAFSEYYGALEARDKPLAEKAKAAGIEEVAFDRSGFKYHGRVKALAEAARENGLKF